MANNKPHPPAVDKLVSDLYKNRLIASHIIRGCDYTTRGRSKKPVVNYDGNGGLGDQRLLKVHCGEKGCYKVFVVPNNAQSLESYISKYYS